jgi:predicted TIM-barrel fold metal-dependent hydrolase
MIVDAHTHFGPALAHDHPMGPVAKATTADELVAQLDQARIDRAVVFAPSWQGGADGVDFIDPNYERANQAVAEGVRRHPERLVGFARVNPKFGSQAVRELERCFSEYGFRGLHLNNTNEWFTPLHVKLLAPLLERCAARGAPVSVHTWFYPSQAYPWLQPIEAFPQVRFILAHMGYRQWADAVIVAERAPNVYLETSLQLPATVKKAVARVGAARVLFGSDTPYAFPDIELRALRDLGLPAADLAMIGGDNMLGLLSMTKKEPATVTVRQPVAAKPS